MTLNKVTLIGRVGNDPERKTLNDGKPFYNFSLATSERWRDKASGDMRERTEWHRVAVFNEHLANLIENYIKKGTQIYLEGKIKTRKWQDQSGQDRYSTEVVIQNFDGKICLLGGKQDNNQASQSQASQNLPSQNQTPLSSAQDAPFDDEIPF